MQIPFLFQVASEGGVNVKIDQIKRAMQNKHGLPHRLEEPGGGQASHGQIYVGIRAVWIVIGGIVPYTLLVRADVAVV